VSALVAALFHFLLLIFPMAFVGAGWHRQIDAPIVMFLVAAVSHGLCEGMTSWRCGDATLLRIDRGTQDQLLASATGLSLLILSWVSLATHSELGVTDLSWPLVGLTLMTIGIALRCLAIVTLGMGFVSALRVQPGQAIVQSGIYRYLRHPSEAGLICVAFGTPVLLGSAAGLVITVATVMPLSWYRIRREEVALHANFGSGYDAYASTVWRYFPRILASKKSAAVVVEDVTSRS
jgi:protein-S-isoprenylcysteine O-methyltransferase Ste14